MMKNVSIIGVTGSIGTQTLDVIRIDVHKYKLIAVTANKSYEKMIHIINEFEPEIAVLTDETAYDKLLNYFTGKNIKTKIQFGMEALNEAASNKNADIVVTSIVGMIGLMPTINAIRAGKDIALANKETLVVGGEIVKREAKKYGVNILPVDSEHGAVFQCLQGNNHKDVKNILLTASGGPFRGKTQEELKNVTVKDALNHPNWSMGSKVTIDSATLMNKGLEVIEAHWLFNMPFSNIKAIVHPQSIIHSMVEYKDGSIIAQMAVPDMKLPIQYALNYPERCEAVIKPLDFFSIPSLQFEKPDLDTFKCLKYAYEAGEAGGIMPTVLNAANEYAVDLFLKEKISFNKIHEIIYDALSSFENKSIDDVSTIIEESKKVINYLKIKYD